MKKLLLTSLLLFGLLSSFTLHAQAPTCGETFTDPGGLFPYANNVDNTVSICPTANPSSVVTVTFTSFNTEATYDALYVFDGNSITSPQIASSNGAGNVPGGLSGGYWGTTIPGPFTSTSPDGCLTFRFRSDNNATRDGWIANVTCSPPPTCLPPSSVTSSSVTNTSATISWTENNAATSWEIVALPCTTLPNASTVGTIVSTNPITLTGLTAATCYRFYVKSICNSSDNSTWSTVGAPTTTLQNPPVCGGIFVDNGGINGNYVNGSNVTTTICPSVAGEVVSVVFSTFDLESTWDALYVYNGNSTSASQISSSNPAGNVPGGLAGGYWGTSIPGPFTSTSTDGCLTFRFVSDGQASRAGWIANIVCGLPPTCIQPSNVTTSAITDTTVNVNWVNNSNATSWEVVALPCNTVPNSNTVGTIVSTNSITLTGLNPLTCYSIFVRGICSQSDSSFWISTTNITTSPEIPECGELFVDTGGPNGNYSNNSNLTYTICPTIIGEIVTVTFTSFDTDVNWDALYVFDGNSILSPQISSQNPAGNVPGGLAGGYWGTTIPGPFTSTSTDGCLTFRFRSSQQNTRSGWIATVTCNPEQDKIIAIAFVDSNANGVFDSNENSFPHGNFMMQQNNTGAISEITTPNGRYIITDENPTNTYDINFEILPEYTNYFSGTSFSVNDASIAVGSGAQLYYFPITVTQLYSDLAITIISTNPPRPGLPYSNKIEYKNIGLSAVANGTLSFTRPSQSTIASITQTGTVSSSQGFSYNFTNLLPGETRSFFVTLNVPPTPLVNAGNLLVSEATITVPSNDIDALNNAYTNTQIVVNSFDPNNKMESRGDRIAVSEFSADDYLFYTIRFQNYGTANAIDVRIEDVISSNLEIESIRMISSSHYYVMSRNNNLITWDFKDIQLVPESVSTTLSVGYVHFKIKVKPNFIAGGNIVRNSASIFFDTNPPITTNQFNSKFITVLGSEDFNTNSFSMYPNPSNDTVTLQVANSQNIKEVSFLDLSGKTIHTIKDVANWEATVNISNFSKGMYFVQVTMDNDLKLVQKLVKK
jgi:uncharacterized repeat protein (TIGR01451 family)